MTQQSKAETRWILDTKAKRFRKVPTKSKLPPSRSRGGSMPNGLELEVAPLTKGKLRLVIARLNREELHRDEVNTNADKSRNHFISTLSKELGDKLSLTKAEKQAIDKNLIQQADRNDEQWRAAQNGDRASDGRLTRDHLLALVADAELIRTPTGELYITLLIGKRPQPILIESPDFVKWMTKQCYEQHHQVPAETLIAETQKIVSMWAEDRGITREVSVRVAANQQKIYLDTGRPDGQVWRVAAKGISLLSPLQVRFKRYKGFQPLPEPQLDGSLTQFFKLLNLQDKSSKILLAGTLVGMLNPSIPQPILLIYGPQGSAKSTTTRLIKQLLDPVIPFIRGQPRNEHDLIIAARHNWILALDNLSNFPDWQSNALCRLSTGAGFGTRHYFTDNEEFTFEGRRSVIINGIAEIATRSDLLDRSIVLNLSPINSKQRKIEAQIDEDFRKCHAQALGCLLSGVQTALKALPDLKTPPGGLPRMADFTKFAMASMPAFGWEPMDFYNAYVVNRSTSVSVALEASIIATPLRRLLEGEVDNPWETTATQLFRKLECYKPQGIRAPANWPKTPNALTRELRELQPAFAADGIDISFHKSNARTITLTLRDED